MPYLGRPTLPQRLEVALLAPPAFAKAPEGLSAALAERRARRSAMSGGGRSGRASSSSASGTSGDSSGDVLGGRPVENLPATPGATWRIAEGVRGAFELVPETPAKDQEKPSWSLVWRPIASAMTADVPDPTAQSRPAVGEAEEESRVFNPAARAAEQLEPDLDLGRSVLATGLTLCTWEAYRGRKFIDKHQVVKAEELPAYVRMNVETLSGTRIEWVFEVGWVIGAEPGTVIRATPGATVGGAGAGSPPQPVETNGQPVPATPTTPARPATGTPVPGTSTPAQPVRPMSPGRTTPSQPAQAAPPPKPPGATPRPAPSKGNGLSPKAAP